MEDDRTLNELLLERAAEYGKISYDLVKLKTLDKISNVVSSFIPHSVVFIFFASFLFFLNLGFALWLGEILGEIFYGFFLVAAFYGAIAIVIRLLLYKWMKKIIGNCIIKHVLN